MFGGDDKRAYQLEQLLNIGLFPGNQGKSGIVSDPLRSMALHVLDPNRPPLFRVGRVVDSIPHFHSYRVLLDKLGGVVVCMASFQSAFGYIGGKQLNSYPPGAKVLVLQLPNDPFGIILTGLPDITVHPSEYANQIIHQGSRVGYGVDLAHTAPLDMVGDCGARNWSSGRPLDSLSNGEGGVIFETGLKLFYDQFMGMLAASEETGLWVHLLDELTRLSGHNLQIRSFGYEKEHLNDEGELHFLEGYSMYPWEALGTFSAAVSPYKVIDEATLEALPELSRYEPVYEDQQPFRRLEKFRGYLGGLEKRHVKLPPQHTVNTIQRFSTDLNYPGVFDESLLPTGQWGVRSAKGIYFAKDMKIVSPKQRRRPEDVAGETDGNYAASGTYNTGPLAPIQAGVTESVSGNSKQGAKLAALMDTMAFAFNWESLATIVYHPLDWHLPEQSDSIGVDWTDASIMFSSLASSQFLEPTAVTMRVDERYGDVVYYRNGSSVALHDDGSVSITAGFGEQLTLAMGSGFLSVPGDFLVQTGKSFLVYAGRDACIKANRSVDISANKKDVRILAGKNFHALSGNTGEGGTLLENRATCRLYSYAGVYGEDVQSSGITLKSIGAPTTILSVETIISNDSPEIPVPGNILIDSTDAKIVTKSSSFERHLTENALDLFESGHVNEFSSTAAHIDTGVFINGILVTASDMQSGGWVYAHEHFASRTATTNYGAVLQLSSLTSLNANIATIAARSAYLANYHTVIAEADVVYPDGLTDTIFSMRTEAQYGTTSVALFENRWQQQARLGGDTVSYWQENPVATRALPTMAHPGYVAWTQAQSFLKVDLVLYDASTGKCADRTSGAYIGATYSTPVGVVPNGNYPVISNP